MPTVLLGVHHYLDIAGPEVFGRYIKTKTQVELHGAERPLIPLFKEGPLNTPKANDRNWCKKSWEDQMVFEVMGLIIQHEGEFRKWRVDKWGAPAVGGSLKAEFTNHVLCREEFFADRIIDEHGTSRIWHTDVGRDVFVVCLPELMMHLGIVRTAPQIYAEWKHAEVIIGPKHRRGTSGTAQWQSKSSGSADPWRWQQPWLKSKGSANAWT